MKKCRVKCPLCNGCGTYLGGNKHSVQIPKLKQKGLNYRQIMKVTGLKSLDTINYYLKRNQKQGIWHKKKN